jgi:serine/threonine protein kinase
MLATDKSSNKEMAIKMIDKAHIKKEKKEAYVTTERDILTKCDSPWIIKLYYTFQDSTYLCIRPKNQTAHNFFALTTGFDRMFSLDFIVSLTVSCFSIVRFLHGAGA